MPAASLLRPAAVSATRAPPRASVSDESGLVDRRRWTSFLTWAFVLSEMAGRDGWLPTAAHAGEEDLGRSGHAGSDTAPIVNNLPTISVSTATEGPESITYQHAATMPAYAPSGLSSELAEAKITPAVESTASGHAAGGGGGGHAGDAATDADATGAHVSLGDAPFLAFGQDGSPLDLGLHFDLGDTVHGLFGVVDGLGDLPLVGDLIDNVGSGVASTTGNLLSTLEPVVSLVGGNGDAFGSGTAAPGQLSFGDGGGTTAHELATPGGYTTYGIALNLGAGDAGSASASGEVDAGPLAGSVLDSFADHLSGSHLDASSDALHLDQSVLRTASDILA
jgi:hypothetical protein